MNIRELSGVGESVAARLERLGINSVEDLITHFPRRYDDYSNVTEISKLKPGAACLRVTFSSIATRRVRRGLHITEALASDDTGSIRVTWFNQPYRASSIQNEQPYYVVGEYALNRGRFSMTNPQIERVSDFPLNAHRIVPKYRETKGLTSAGLRKLVHQALGQLPVINEHLPAWVVASNKLVDYRSAIVQMHFPDSPASLEKAKKRLGFEEVFRLSLAALLNKHELLSEKSLAIPFDKKVAQKFVAKLPFALTNAQRRVAWDALTDIGKTQPMNRLVEGDVGSGKTVVAALVALMAMSKGFQVALMAPTEILARQHYESLTKIFESVDMHTEIELLVGSVKGQQRQNIYANLASGDLRLIVGTQALFQTKVVMKKLGFIIVDEQHRFGVEQRKKLQAKAGHMPHVLHLSATPIPRSLALTLYGELDISLIDELPKGRLPINTKLHSPNSRESLYRQAEVELDAGRQVYVVCPQIVEGDDSSLLSAEVMYEKLKSGHFKSRRVGLVHGKMKSDQKEAVMKDFKQGKIDVLVCTTVIEVGIDVPNATCMIIEAAERFGLAQLHQLRGRVGRGLHQSHCFLVPSSSQVATTRLSALETTHDGFKLAELDLRLRGPGAIYGTNQHGALDLRVAKLSDTKLIAAARASAQAFIDQGENLLQYPQLAAKVSALRAVTNLN